MININGIDFYDIPSACISAKESVKTHSLHQDIANKGKRLSYIWYTLRSLVSNLIYINAKISELPSEDIESIKELIVENLTLGSINVYIQYAPMSFLTDLNNLIIAIDKISNGFLATCRLLGYSYHPPI
jgi:hypothetical protein